MQYPQEIGLMKGHLSFLNFLQHPSGTFTTQSRHDGQLPCVFCSVQLQDVAQSALD